MRPSRRRRLFLPSQEQARPIEPVPWPQPAPLPPLPPPSGIRYAGGARRFVLPSPRAIPGIPPMFLGWASSSISIPMLAFSERVERRKTPTPVPVVNARPGVIRAQKRGNLTDFGDKPFTGRFANVNYGVEATAICAGRGWAASYHECCAAPEDAGRHPAPHPDCSCGFHAHLHGPQMCCTGPGWLFEVELHGKVVEHEDGYRAQRQRVLSVTPSSTCALCIERTAEVFAAYDGKVRAVCAMCTAIPMFSYPLPGTARYPQSLSRARLAARIAPAVLNDFAPI